MFSLQPEIESLLDVLGERRTTALVDRERREVFSLYPELRLLGWAGAMLLATAAAIVLKNNLERIGPLALALLMALAAAGCYAFVWLRRGRASLADDYVLLLASLLVSGDAAFIETQFKIFGEAWYRHFLLLAVWHGVAAYLFRSRIVLSLSITALAAWLGVRQGMAGETTPLEFAGRAFACAAVLLVWRALNRRAEFARTFEHFAANITLAGATGLLVDDAWRIRGCLVLLALATSVIVWGFHTRREAFVLYAFLYAVVAVDTLLLQFIGGEAFTFFVVVLSMIGAIVALIVIHAKFRELTA